MVEINECLLSPCHAKAICNNTEGSYTCTCDSGYSGDGILCNGRRLLVSNTLIMRKTLLEHLKYTSNHRQSKTWTGNASKTVKVADVISVIWPKTIYF